MVEEWRYESGQLGSQEIRRGNLLERKWWHPDGELKAHDFSIKVSRFEYYQHGISKYFPQDDRRREYALYYNGRKMADLTTRIVMSVLYVKDRLCKRIRRKIREQHLDKAILPDLGDIIMLYYTYN